MKRFLLHISQKSPISLMSKRKLVLQNCDCFSAWLLLKFYKLNGLSVYAAFLILSQLIVFSGCLCKECLLEGLLFNYFYYRLARGTLLNIIARSIY